MPSTPTAQPTKVVDQLAKLPSSVDQPASPSKLDTLASLLRREGGATVLELCAATGWQTHSVRGAMSGALKKRGLIITSTKADGMRRYAARAEAADQ